MTRPYLSSDGGTMPEPQTLVDQVKAKQARLVELFAEAAAIEQELTRAFLLLSPSSGRPRPALQPRVPVQASRPVLVAPEPAPEPVVVAPEPPAPTADVDRLVRYALMSGPMATPTDAHELRILQERCEDISGLAPDTVERVLEGLLERGLVKRDGRLYRRAA